MSLLGIFILPGIFLTTFENLDFRELIQESYVKTLLRLNQTILETFEKLNLLNKTSYFRLITQKYDIFGFTGDFQQKSPVKTKTMSVRTPRQNYYLKFTLSIATHEEILTCCEKSLSNLPSYKSRQNASRQTGGHGFSSFWDV